VLDYIPFQRYSGAVNDVFAVQIDTPELLDMIVKFRWQSSAVYINDYFVLDIAGVFRVVSEANFVKHYSLPELLSIRDVENSRTWLVDYEVQDVSGMQHTRYVAPKDQNTLEDVRRHFENTGVSFVTATPAYARKEV